MIWNFLSRVHTCNLSTNNTQVRYFVYKCVLSLMALCLNCPRQNKKRDPNSNIYLYCAVEVIPNSSVFQDILSDRYFGRYRYYKNNRESSTSIVPPEFSRTSTKSCQFMLPLSNPQIIPLNTVFRIPLKLRFTIGTTNQRVVIYRLLKCTKSW